MRKMAKRKRLLLGALAALFILNPMFSVANTNLEEMVRRASHSPVISLSSREYKKFVLEQPRLYTVFVLFIAQSSMCPSCPGITGNFARVAESYKDAGAMEMPADRKNEKTEENKRPVFFVKVNGVESRDVAMLHGLMAVPFIASVDFEEYKPGKTLPFPETSTFKFDKFSDVNSALLNFCNWRTGRKVELSLAVDKMSMFILALSILVFGGFTMYRLCLYAQQHPWVPLLFAMGMQWLSTAGIFWSQQHNAGLFGFDRATNSPVFFVRNRRAQYLGEGLVMSLMSMMFSIFLFGLYYLPKVEAVRKRQLQNWAVWTLLPLAIILYTAIFRAHELKTGIYHTSFFPPPQFSHGSLLNDRGNSY